MRTTLVAVSLFVCYFSFGAQEARTTASGAALASPSAAVSLWWSPSSARKIRPQDQPPEAKGEKRGQAVPTPTGESISMSSARNERESAQLVVRPRQTLSDFRIRCAELRGPSGSSIASENLELLQVMYVDITEPSDRSSQKGLWPDPLVPVALPLELKPEFNHAFWLRVFVPSNAVPGKYTGEVELTAKDFAARVPVELEVYDFDLPARMTCTTAFGFSPGNIFRYHRVSTEADKRRVLDKYWANLAAHHISPYDPAPLDPIKVKWPEIKPPRTIWENWQGLRVVTNEVHSGRSALLIYDDKVTENVSVTYEPLIRIPNSGLKLRCWYRTAVPGHRFILTLTHYDSQRQWMSGKNNDMTLRGNGQWEELERELTKFPAGAEYVRFQARGTVWSDKGEDIGLCWLDDVSITEIGSGKQLLEGGDFERKPRTETVVPADQLKVTMDFTAWDKAMTEAINRHHFNSFQVDLPGMGGGTFHAITPPSLLGFEEDAPEYRPLFDSYATQLEKHLVERGWSDEAYVYWFDEPEPDQYPFVMNGFAKLKRSCPSIARMLTEQVEPGLIGGPDIWCSISDQYDHARAEERRPFGEKFWWYVCTGPKAPYAGLFIDHASPEMRIWLWQTFQRNIEGILVWETTYWTSGAAYPERNRPQDPYADPMSWMSGYSTPAGTRRAWGNGDGRFIYPALATVQSETKGPVLDGPLDSIRWEHLRDGIEDYEYLCILRKRLAQRKSSVAGEVYEKYASLLRIPDSITRSLTEFADDGEPIEGHRKAVARAIEELDGL